MPDALALIQTAYARLDAWEESFGPVQPHAAMAAAGYAGVLGGSNAQVMHAAELALRPHLGMTCDPAAGHIEEPCIERNAVAASRACHAALEAVRMPSPYNGIDATIRAMIASGQRMASRAKATSLAGVAVSLAEC